VEERYDASASSTLFGSSLGGLFVLYALFQHPDAFDAFISVSPALWWDDQLLLRQEDDLAASQEDVEATLFLAVGSEEERADIPTLAPFRMVSNVRTFAERLAARGYPSLDLATYVAEGESHTTVVPVALTRGLRYIHRVRPSAGTGVPRVRRRGRSIRMDLRDRHDRADPTPVSDRRPPGRSLS